MDVVLKQDVDKLGLRGEVVAVARGYARNFLLPRGLAEVATPGLVRELEKRDAQRARHEAKSDDEARAIATRLQAKELRFDVNAGPTGSLFGSVTATNIADRLWETEKIRVDRRKLQMDTIKRVGRFTVSFEVFAGVVAELKIVVAPEGQEPPEEAELAAMAAEEEAAQRELDGRGPADAVVPEAEGPGEIEEAVVEAEAETPDEAEPDAEQGSEAEPDDDELDPEPDAAA